MIRKWKTYICLKDAPGFTKGQQYYSPLDDCLFDNDNYLVLFTRFDDYFEEYENV